MLLLLGVAAAAAAWGGGAEPVPPAPRAPFVVPFGAGERYRPPSLSAAVARGRPIGRLRCTRDGAARATVSRRRMASFRGPVRAWVNGRRWGGEPGALPLRPGGQVVVAIGTARVPVHADYEFPG